MYRQWLLAISLASPLGLAAGCAGTAADNPPRSARNEQTDIDEEVAPSPRPARLHGPKKRIGIVDFDDASHGYHGSRSALAETARDAATEALVKSGAFVVIEREQIAQVLKEQGLGMTGAISPQTAAKAGKLLGLQALITGKVTDFDTDQKSSGFGGYYRESTKTYRARVSLRVTDANTGEIWIAESAEGAAEEKNTSVMGGGSGSDQRSLGKRALYSAVNSMIIKIVAKSDAKPWSGTVAKVGKGNKIYVTAGSDIGLPVGASLAVRRLGEEITDPSTGAVIGHELGRNVGKLQVADHLNEKLSVCIVARGAGFSSGDIVTLEPAGLTAAR